MNFDTLIATQRKCLKLVPRPRASVPRGLMPNPRVALLPPMCQGRPRRQSWPCRIRADSAGIVHLGVG